ncbi:unnamed protein product [Sphagnum troendelagicum]|uniref:Uncharacterized protein n=1 Tax=Sphagnum troendelagicum TaxID=128251 RepID=A0ABP0UFX3_9BRYO
MKIITEIRVHTSISRDPGRQCISCLHHSLTCNYFDLAFSIHCPALPTHVCALHNDIWQQDLPHTLRCTEPQHHGQNLNLIFNVHHMHEIYESTNRSLLSSINDHH